MSFEPRTRLQKILMGIAATPRTALEHAVKYAVDNSVGSSAPVYVPFAVTASAGGMSATTTATFADVKAALKANKTVVGQVTINEQIVLIAPCNAFYPVENITAIGFETVAKLNDSDKPTFYKIEFTSATVVVEEVELT